MNFNETSDHSFDNIINEHITKSLFDFYNNLTMVQ